MNGSNSLGAGILAGNPLPAAGRRYSNMRCREQGAALLIALVMITVVSIMGVSAMRGATLETRLAANAMQKETTFQSADSATDAILNTDGLLESVICADDDERTLTDLNVTAGQSTIATTGYGGQTLPIGWELGGAFSAHRFVVRARSSIDAVHTATDVSQGVMLIGAANPGGPC